MMYGHCVGNLSGISCRNIYIAKLKDSLMADEMHHNGARYFSDDCDQRFLPEDLLTLARMRCNFTG